MFKQLAFLCSVCLVLALSACGKSQDVSTTVINEANGHQSEASATPKNLVIYSSRNEDLILPLIKAYEQETGTKVRFLTDKPEPLIEKLKAEAEQTPADILMTVDAGNLWRASQVGLFQSVDSGVLSNAIPLNMRDKDNQWFGFSQRARTIVYSTERVDPNELSTYEDLADAKWKGRLCLRTSKKVYNQSLVAMLIATHGKEKTEEIVKGWVNNLATDPFANDTSVMKAILAGQCDVSLVNTYYFGGLQKEEPGIALKLFWPNQNIKESDAFLHGVHVNISGAGVLKNAKHPETAIHFLEWMSGKKAQSILAHGNMEYPVVENVDYDELVKAWGSFKADTNSLSLAGELQSQAVMLMDRAGYR